MVYFNEFIPRGGWLRYNKVRKWKRRAGALALVLVLVLAFGVVGQIEVCGGW